MPTGYRSNTGYNSPINYRGDTSSSSGGTGFPWTLRYLNLISLGSVELTDETRKPITENRDERGATVELASGKKRKYIKGVVKNWSIEWDMVALNSSLTIDGKGGRNEIRSLAQSGSPLAFTFRDATGTVESYTVFVTSYNESMVLRRGTDSRFKITLEVEEQG